MCASAPSGFPGPTDEYGVRLNEELVEFLVCYGTPRSYEKGELLVREGDPSTFVLVVTVGQADVLKAGPDGTDCVINQVGKGDVIGEMGAFLEVRRSATIRARTSVRALRYDNATFLIALEKIPELAMRLFKTLSLRLSRASERLAAVVHSHHLLSCGVGLLRRCAEPDVNPAAFDLDLARLAEATDCPPEQFRVSLEELQKKGALILEKSQDPSDHVTVHTNLQSLFHTLFRLAKV